MFDLSWAFAEEQDQKDTLKNYRNQFYFPQRNGKDAIYFCGNSLGLQAKNVQPAVIQELEDWQQCAVEGYWGARYPWLFYQQYCSRPLMEIVGASQEELTVMNTLTVNLHYGSRSVSQRSVRCGNAGETAWVGPGNGNNRSSAP
jgi:kynureninase